MFGGMRSSLQSDVLQAVLQIVFFIGFLLGMHAALRGNDSLVAFADKHSSSSLFVYNPKTTWNIIGNGTADSAVPATWTQTGTVDMKSLKGGVDLICVGILQGLFSYPFMVRARACARERPM
jgi:hypothetical protein